MSDEKSPVHDAAGTETVADGKRDVSDHFADVFDQFAEEFAERCRLGENPSIAEYEARYPEHVAKIRRLLPTVALMEQLRRGARKARAGEATRPPPERLGEFRVLRELGRGGMGVVYEAVQESLGRHVALKVVHVVHLDAKRLQRFQREAQAVAQLHHTNIVPIFAVGDHEGLPFYAMQYIRGHGLDVLLATWREERPAGDADRWRFVARVGMQAAEALDYAHGQGILHRDVKPANLLIDDRQTVWVTDFGLAKLSGHDDLTASGDVIGTLRYLAPEALRGETDARSDVYSLGLTLYELLTLSPPFGELSPSELLRHVSEAQPARPRRLDPAIPRDLETIVLKAIAREPGARYPTAGALAADLGRFLEDRPIQARRAGPIERAWRWSRRNRATAALAAAAAASLFLAAVVGWAGYVMTSRALHKADANVALSLAVFEELFEKLAPNDSLPPPPLGVSGRQSSPQRGGERGPGGPPGNRPGGRDRPPFAQSPLQADDTELLRSVLSFYDRFARQNATNPRLQGEAAWAYRKVGALYERLGHDVEAEAAYSRSIDMFEGLVDQYPRSAEYRAKLVDTYDMADPWSTDPSNLERLERRLRRARAIGDELASEAPGNLDYALARVHLHAKLAVALQRLNRASDAEACHRRAIALEGESIGRWPANGRLRIDRSVTREALALLLIERTRPDEARAVLDAAVADLDSLQSNGRMGAPPPHRYESLAAAYTKLGDAKRADEMNRRSAQVRERLRPGPPGPKSFRPGQAPPGAPDRF